jgi:K(+)-stimulated pyrophosphate-energized sodium pump
MNILIKLTCLIGLVIAPILGAGHEGNKVVKMEMECHETMGMSGKCDMAKMATMTKDECAVMCDEMGCTPADKAMCMAHYDANGKFITAEGKACCAADAKTTMSKDIRVEISNVNGKAKGTVTSTVNGKVDVQTFEGTEAEVRAKVDAIK